MVFHKRNPARDEMTLRKRVGGLFSKLGSRSTSRGTDFRLKSRQMGLNFSEPDACASDDTFRAPSTDITEFLNLIECTLPDGDLYLFGGVLRDLALFGEKGFNSDIDIVVDGDWELAYPKLLRIGASINKFGGLRFFYNNQSIDMWLAKETWAVKQGLVQYKGIASLLDTTVLNWDAILMNWRTKSFLCCSDFFNDLQNGYMDIVLEPNPNPLGMLVRVMRHILQKDADTISYHVYEYLCRSIDMYDFDDIVGAEFVSYGANYIHQHFYEVFKQRSFLLEECVGSDGIRISYAKEPARPLL